MAVRSVPTTRLVGDVRVHLFQVVREHRPDGDEDWVVVGFTDDRIDLATVGFDWHRAVSPSAFDTGELDPWYENGVPVWGY